ncbi:bifunctional diguanylate cyclase/phosphodiesterase [Roseibium aquae]|uniref:Bifunctional diguanylate cyclase/phosphodiesterase n=1 Tax=Roseibium aquae TaxID=1323746 RepID=A0A916WUB4_9HYPH|nr:EAL domain-containing protein [Roseibium aquae]GGB33395.1 bifunctional diguanylate cyclase/phosphodiesterase [Roseibium aquae]
MYIELIYFLFAILVCMMGSFAILHLHVRLSPGLHAASGALRRTVSVVVIGTTIWTVQMIPLLSFDAIQPQVFSSIKIALSFLAAMIYAAAASSLHPIAKRAGIPEIEGAIIGFGSWTVHLIGQMSAVHEGHESWNLLTQIQALLLCVMFSALAFACMSRQKSTLGALAGLVFFTVANVGLYLFSMQNGGTSDGPAIFWGHMSSLFLLACVTAAILLLGLTVSSVLVAQVKTQAGMISRLKFAALHDTLTGLPNRDHLTNFIDPKLRSAADAGKRAAVVCLSLSKFKRINEFHGIAAGDRILRAFASNLSDALKRDEYLCRFSGDEFVAIKTDLDSAEDAKVFANRLRAAALTPVKQADYRISLEPSIGLAVMPDDSWHLETLVFQAGLASSQAERLGNSQTRPYGDGLEEAYRRRACLAADLKTAISDGQFRLVFQPLVRIRDRSVYGYEALIRWQHPVKGLLNPIDVIPIAENTGLIVDLGAWALREACREAATWRPDLSVSVNTSPVQLSRSDFPGLVEAVLADTGLDPERLEIEVTETSTIETPDKVTVAINKLRTMGLKVVLDDFGTGYSSLNTLQNFTFDKIKIDRVFTQSIETDARSRAIIRSAVLLGHSFKIPVLAEGVENERQLRFLKEAGCFAVQGYLFSKPINALQIPEAAFPKRPDPEHFKHLRAHP